MTEERTKGIKPLGRKAYGSIGHLPNSRMGPSDHSIHEGQARICTEKVRDKCDRVIVQEKLDGSCVSVAILDGEVLALTRAGYLANTSPYEQHHLFHSWVEKRQDRFRSVLNEGERLVGEWLAQAHGTRYDLHHEPFVAFDIMREAVRLPYWEFCTRILRKFTFPSPLAYEPISVEEAMSLIQPLHHGSIDPPEGVMYRVERNGKVDFLAKYVRPDKVDGVYLPEVSGKEAVWNWRPDFEVSEKSQKLPEPLIT
jgi:hypothetical protein